jgi:arabinose operon protein AraL
MFKGFIFDLDGTIYRDDQLIPGADDVIRLLRERSRKVVFVSDKPIQSREDEASRLTRLGIPTEPDEVINSAFVTGGTPSSLIIQAALEAMGLMPEDCILIGDNLETDIRMGKDSGIATGIVLTGVTDEKTLEGYKHTSHQPDFVFQSIAEVANLLIG